MRDAQREEVRSLDIESPLPRRLRRRCCPTPPPAARGDFRPSAFTSAPPPAQRVALSPHTASGGVGRLSAFGLHVSGLRPGIRTSSSFLQLLAGEITNLQNGIPLFRFSFDAENCLVLAARFLSSEHVNLWWKSPKRSKRRHECKDAPATRKAEVARCPNFNTLHFPPEAISCQDFAALRAVACAQ